jgi:hypothetical protein
MATRTACACCRGWPTSSHHDQRSVRLRNRQCALTSRSEKYSLALAAPSSVSPHIRITHPPLPRERSAPSLPSIFPPPVPVLSHYLLSPSPLPPPPPPLPPFALSALLALRGPALQQSPRPGSSLPSPASPCLWPAWLTTISPVAPIHLQHRHTHTHTHSPDTSAYYSPEHTWTAPSPSHNSTSSLRPSFRRFHNQNHTTPAFPAPVCPPPYCTRHPTCTSPDS